LKPANSTKHELYRKAFFNTVFDADIKNPDPAAVKKLIFYGIKILSTKPEPSTIEEAEINFQLADTIQRLIGLLAPAEFVNLFPITKEYDGQRWGVKDYFYTRDYINGLPDEPIGNIETVMKFLWEYHNKDIHSFLVKIMCNASAVRKFQGQKSIMEEWADMNGITTYTMHTDQKGKRYLVDRKTGKSFRVKKKMPRYLRPVGNTSK